MLPKARSPGRDKAKEIYLQHSGNIPLADIANQLGIPEGTVRGWKNKDHWDGKSNGTFRKNMERSKQQKKADKAIIQSVEENDELTEMEKLFCLHFVRTFNATQSAIRAGYSAKTAYSIGYNLLHKQRVADEVKRLKAIKNEVIMAGAEDVIEKMMRIAFSDITGFTEFKGNSVKLLPSDQVDGTLIREVSEGRDGVKIKLLDSQRALEWLGQYFLMNPMDKHRIEYENKKLQLDEQKAKGEDSSSGQLEA